MPQTLVEIDHSLVLSNVASALYATTQHSPHDESLQTIPSLNRVDDDADVTGFRDSDIGLEVGFVEETGEFFVAGDVFVDSQLRDRHDQIRQNDSDRIASQHLAKDHITRLNECGVVAEVESHGEFAVVFACPFRVTSYSQVPLATRSVSFTALSMYRTLAGFTGISNTPI